MAVFRRLRMGWAVSASLRKGFMAYYSYLEELK
jgi:hypothetical protein